MQQHITRRNDAAVDSGVQYLTFGLGDEQYALDILRVQEIRGFSAITPIPNAPPHVKGVINLRGTVVPVIGLRERFGMPAVAYDQFTVIIVVAVGTKVVGMIVDAVTDVLSLTPDDVEPPPDFGDRVDASVVTGMAKSGERLLVVLDIDGIAGEAATDPNEVEGAR